MWRSTPRIEHGEAVFGSQLMSPVGNTGPLFHAALEICGEILPDVMLPVPCDPPGPTPNAPVGVLPRPNALLKARKVCQFTVSYTRPAPPRRTVFPLPVMSHAKPARGAKL